jgi:transposase
LTKPPDQADIIVLGERRSRISTNSQTRLVAPANITLPTLPPYSPEPNPVGTIWRFLRQNHRANRIFDSCDATVDVCRNAWNALLETSHRVASITSRGRAQVNR